MSIELQLPRVGTSMEEAQIMKWHKAPGDAFSEGEALYDIETDKVTYTVEATMSGRITAINVPEGEVATVGQVVATAEAAP
ncbi:MAG: lipoyl domain-containing protein [Dehalococcoidia bacterium]